jgi:thymidine phosphorylase
MLSLAGVADDPAAALDDGRAMAKYSEMIRAQGGDPEARMPDAPERHTLTATKSGYLQRLDARAVGIAAWRLGAGRSRKEDPVSAVAGVVCLAKPGEEVAEGQPLLELHAEERGRFEHALAALRDGIEIGPEAPEPKPLIIEKVTA